jgi:hypothetical protein
MDQGHRTIRYEIGIRGTAGIVVADAFADLTVVSGKNLTVLSGPCLDQAALHGVLARIRDLGLELLWTREVGWTHEEEIQSKPSNRGDKRK